MDLAADAALPVSPAHLGVDHLVDRAGGGGGTGDDAHGNRADPQRGAEPDIVATTCLSRPPAATASEGPPSPRGATITAACRPDRGSRADLRLAAVSFRAFLNNVKFAYASQQDLTSLSSQHGAGTEQGEHRASGPRPARRGWPGRADGARGCQPPRGAGARALLACAQQARPAR